VKLEANLDDKAVGELLAFLKRLQQKDLKNQMLFGLLMNLPIHSIALEGDQLCIKVKVLGEIKGRIKYQQSRVILYDYNYHKILMLFNLINRISGKKLEAMGLAVGEKEIVLDFGKEKDNAEPSV
jgi:hypothetical protein